MPAQSDGWSQSTHRAAVTTTTLCDFSSVVFHLRFLPAQQEQYLYQQNGVPVSANHPRLFFARQSISQPCQANTSDGEGCS